MNHFIQKPKKLRSLLVGSAIGFLISGCATETSDEWQLAPANGGIGTWSGDTVVGSDTVSLVLDLSVPAGGTDSVYECHISVNGEEMRREGGTWWVDPEASYDIHLNPIYRMNLDEKTGELEEVLPTPNPYTAGLQTDSILRFYYLTPDNWITIPTRLQ